MRKEIDVYIGGFDDGHTPGVQQYDANSREYVCRLWERRGVPFRMSENAFVGAVFSWRKSPPSNEYEVQILDCSTVLVKVPAAATQHKGAVDMQLIIHQNGGVLHGPYITFMVYKSMRPSDDVTDEPALLLETLVDQSANAITNAENAAQKAIEAAEKAEQLVGNIDGKLDTTGHSPDKYLGTDENGNVIEKEPPSGGISGEYVTSVNGRTGDVSLTASDVGALPVGTKIPSATNDLTNNSGFITNAASDLANYYLKSQTYTRDEINQRISAIPKFTISVVSSLPTNSISETTIYLVSGGEGSDLYTEYIHVNGAWEILGSQRTDLTGYATETWVIGQLAGYQPKGDYALRSEIPAVPTKLSQLADDSTHRLVTDAEKAAWSAKSDFSGSYNDLTDKPTIPAVPVQSVNGKTGAVKLTASDVGADPAGTAVAVVSEHNADPNAHQDIRLALQQLAERINAVLDSDDATLDELSEIVAYIKSNKTLIDAISTSKVNVSDIINNLTTNVANKPLSAAQGVALKALIDAITVPTKVSQLTNDAGYLTEHQDISGKLDADKLPEAVNDALAQAKASGVFDGADGKDGSDANVTAQNVTAALGYTPADAEKVRQLSEEVDAIGTRDQIVQDVLDAIGTPVFGVVDEENNIILTGALADGTYTLKYEFEDGTVSEVGTIEVGSSMPTSGTVELVWENGVKIDKATGVAGSGSAYAASQHIELWDGYTYTATQQMVNGHIFSGISICYYAEDGSYLGYEELWASDSNPHTAVFTPLANAATFRVRGYFTTDYYTECVSVTYEKTA